MEMLIVLAILAIAALVVVPIVGDSQMMRVRTAARMLVADLEHAQLESIGSAADLCLIVFDTTGQSYFIARQSDPDEAMTNPMTGLPYITRFGEGTAQSLTGVTIVNLEVGGDNRLGFTAAGALDQPTDAGITLQCGSETMKISIDAVTGEAAVESAG